MVVENQKLQDDLIKRLASKGIDVSSLSQTELEKIKEFEGRVEAMVKTTGGDYSLIVQPGKVWAMNVEKGIMTYPLNDLLNKGIELTLGYALHEGGHRDITRVVDKYWYGRETLRALFNVIEDPRVNTYEEKKWAGGSLFLSKTYEVEWPKLDVTKGIEHYDDYKVLPHLQFLNSIIYYYRYNVIDPRINNSIVRDIFNKTIGFVKDAYSQHPPGFKPTEEQKREAQKQMSTIVKNHILSEYEKLIKESANTLEKGLLTGRIELGFGPGTGQPGIGTLSEGELTQKARDFIERKSKEIADKFEAKIAKKELEELKKELIKEKKFKELKNRSGDRIQNLKELVENKVFNERLCELQKTEWDKYLSPISSLVTTLTGLLENELTKDERPKYRGYYRSGKKVDLRKYFQFKASMYDPSYEKFWMKKSLPKKPSIGFTLVIDESGSMVEGERDVNALQSLVLFIEVLNHFGIDFNIIGFSDVPLVHKEFDETIEPSNKDVFIKKVASFMGVGATDDASAVTLAIGTMIKESGAEHKVIIVLSDGEGNTGKSKNAGIDRKGRYYNIELNRILEKADLHEIDVVGIGVGEGIKYVHDIYGKSIVEKNIAHLPQAFADLMIEKILEEKAMYSNLCY